MNRVVSIEMAHKLLEAGWPQDEKTENHWYQQVGGVVVDTDVRGRWIVRPKSELALGFGDCIAAPSVEEIFEALPKNKCNGFILGKNGGGILDYWAECSFVLGGEKIITHHANAADALAKLWIKL